MRAPTFFRTPAHQRLTSIGLLFGALRPSLPGTGLGQGLAFGAVLVLLFAVLFLLADQEGELHVAPLPAAVLFSLLALSGGVVVAAVAARLERSLPAPHRWRTLYRSLTVVAVLACLWSLPALLWRVMLAVQRLVAVLFGS